MFYDFEINTKLHIVTNIIASKTGFTKTIGARKCELRNVKKLEVIDFCNHHLHGPIWVYKSAIGLYYENELVALGVFGKSRSHKLDSDYELLRYVCKPLTTISGGLSKIIASFKKEYSGKILSYADLRISIGLSYESINGKRLKDTTPGYFWIHNQSKNKISRIASQKHKLKELLINFDITKTEYCNMIEAGYLKVSDLGHRPYIL